MIIASIAIPSITDNTILDIAIEIIGRDGADDLTFASLATQAKLAPATLVQRFRTKQDLLFRVAERCMSDTEMDFMKAREHSSSPLK